MSTEIDKILEGYKQSGFHPQVKIRAVAAIEQLIDKAREETHALYPDKEEYFAKPAVEQLLLEARLDEMQRAEKAWLTKSLVKHMDNRQAELKSKIGSKE